MHLIVIFNVYRTPLPPCATLDGRFSTGGEEQRGERKDPDSDSLTNYGNPAESYFMARLLQRSRLVDTLAPLTRELAAPAPAPPATALPDHRADKAPPAEPASPPAAPPAADDPRPDPDDVGIQINEVSSSSPTEAPPRPRGRRPRSEAPAPHDRVLRSHDADTPQRPLTRQTGARGRPAASAPALDRVVILSRRAPPAPARPPERPAPRRPPAEPEPAARATRSSAPPALAALAPSPAPATPLAQKITRSISSVARELRGAAAAAGARAGNSARAPGPARRTPAARRDGCSKENLGAARPRPARAAVPAPPPRRPRRADSPEVHSTTPEPRHYTRALRSRNDAAPAAPAPAPSPLKRRGDCEAGGGGKAARLSGERCARLSRRAGPWAPALALRNRLRKRLAK